jgi:hypothetical protein
MDEQQLLMCAHEDCELWQVRSGLAEIIRADDAGVIERARELVRRYVDLGWIAVAREDIVDGVWIARPVEATEMDLVLADDTAWASPTGPRVPGERSIVVTLTDVGGKALEDGAAADAFAAIGRKRKRD